MKAGNCGSDQELPLAVQLLESPWWMEAVHGTSSSDGHGEVRTVPGSSVLRSAAAGSEGYCAAEAVTVSEEASVVRD